jgi:hypothetical protein
MKHELRLCGSMQWNIAKSQFLIFFIQFDICIDAVALAYEYF